MKIKLKLTRKQPIFRLGVDESGNRISGREYLYTNTGEIKRWCIAMKMVYILEEPEKELEFEFEEIKEKNRK